MKKFLALALFLLFPLIAKAQVYVGPQGEFGSSDGSIGVQAGFRAPVGSHFEAGINGTYSPLNWHLGLGRGYSQTVYPWATVWFSQHVGLEGGIEESGYTYQHKSKDLYYVKAGPSVRGHISGAPVIFTFSYVQEVANGIFKDGTETSHVKGGEVSYYATLARIGRVNIVLTQSFAGYHVLEQGNPYCDGTISTVQCGGVKLARTPASGGNVRTGILFQF